MSFRKQISRLSRRTKRRINVWVSALYYLLQEHDIGWRARFLSSIAIAYALSPIDLIPDFIPILGALDDALIIPGLLYLAFRSIPSSVRQSCMKKATQNPVHLAQNWKAAIIIILIWLAIVSAVVFLIIKPWVYGK